MLNFCLCLLINLLSLIFCSYASLVDRLLASGARQGNFIFIWARNWSSGWSMCLIFFLIVRLFKFGRRVERSVAESFVWDNFVAELIYFGSEGDGLEGTFSFKLFLELNVFMVVVEVIKNIWKGRKVYCFLLKERFFGILRLLREDRIRFFSQCFELYFARPRIFQLLFLILSGSWYELGCSMTFGWLLEVDLFL